MLRDQVGNQQRGNNRSRREQRMQHHQPFCTARFGLTLFQTLPQIIHQQQRAGRNRGQNITGQLRLRDREKHDRHDQPAARENAELLFEINARQLPPVFVQPTTDAPHAPKPQSQKPSREQEPTPLRASNTRMARCGGTYSPRTGPDFARTMNSRKNSGLRICTAIYHGSAIAQNRKIPGSHNVFKTSAVREPHRVKKNHQSSEKRRDRALRQRPQRHEAVKNCEVNFFPLSRQAHQPSIPIVKAAASAMSIEAARA